MDKIIEELFNSLIRRIEILESQQHKNSIAQSSVDNGKGVATAVYENKTADNIPKYPGYRQGMISEPQWDFIYGLGGQMDLCEKMTSRQASAYIETLKEREERNKFPKNYESLEVNQYFPEAITKITEPIEDNLTPEDMEGFPDY